MVIVTHNEKEYYPVLMGSFDCPEISEYITCIEENDPSLDLFGNPVLIKIHVSEIKGFKGSYSFAPFTSYKK